MILRNAPWNIKYFIVYLLIIAFFTIYVLNTYESGLSIFTNMYTTKPENIQAKYRVQAGVKYILQWTDPNTEPFVQMGIGQQGFIDRKCPYTNCFVTSDRNLLEDYTNFDVIAFAGPQVQLYREYMLPRRRSPHQKYIFASIESAANYPINSYYFDDFFNWTWTYRIASDLMWGYISVRDVNGLIIGPNKTINWIKHDEMLPISDELRNMLRSKNKAAAWLVSNCDTTGGREDYVAELHSALQTKYNLSVDIYGRCGKLVCEDCDELIRKDYFFYLAFENSFSEDYVTEKLSRALECDTIPIVYGGANYNRFLPNGSYLNAREFEVEALAAKMNELINDFDQYVEYFRWTNHYIYDRRDDASLQTNDYCEMCALLNDESKVKNVSTYKFFRKWWNDNNYFATNDTAAMPTYVALMHALMCIISIHSILLEYFVIELTGLRVF